MRRGTRRRGRWRRKKKLKRRRSVVPSAGEEPNMSPLGVFFDPCRTRCWRKDTSTP